jgi:cell division protein FtsA
VIPLGSNNITKDIASLQMEESAAEQMKLKYGSAWTDNGEIDNNMSLSIDADRSVKSREFISIVEGRMEEIIENVWYQVPSEYADRLLGGIILTGGGANMKNIETAFRNHTHIDKIRIAKFVTQSISAKDPLIAARNGMMNTVLGLLAKGDMNCAGDEVDTNGDLFKEKKPAPAADIHREPRKANELGPGVVQTEAEKQKVEEEKRRQEEEAEAAAKKALEEEAEAKRLAEEEEKKKNSSLKKTGSKLKSFFKSLIAEPEEE